MIKSLLFAGIAAIGNAIFAYGQRGSEPSENPFLFPFGAVFVCTLLFLGASVGFKTNQSIAFVARNGVQMLISGVGFFVTFFGFYLLYTKIGASQYIIYAILSIITTSVGVGVICYKEPFNIYHTGALLSAVLTIFLFYLGQQKA